MRTFFVALALSLLVFAALTTMFIALTDSDDRSYARPAFEAARVSAQVAINTQADHVAASSHAASASRSTEAAGRLSIVKGSEGAVSIAKHGSGELSHAASGATSLVDDVARAGTTAARSGAG